MPTRCTPDQHEALKRSDAWHDLPLLGYQQTVADDDSVAWLELKNCALCCSTLAVLVMIRDGQGRAA